MHVEIHMFDTLHIQQDVLWSTRRLQTEYRINEFSRKTNTIMEINANPKRLDLNAETVKNILTSH